MSDDRVCPKCKGMGHTMHGYADAPERFDVELTCDGCSGTGYRKATGQERYDAALATSLEHDADCRCEACRIALA